MSSNNVDNYGRQDNPRETRTTGTRRTNERARERERDKTDIVLASFERLPGGSPFDQPHKRIHGRCMVGRRPPRGPWLTSRNHAVVDMRNLDSSLIKIDDV